MLEAGQRNTGFVVLDGVCHNKLHQLSLGMIFVASHFKCFNATFQNITNLLLYSFLIQNTFYWSVIFIIHGIYIFNSTAAVFEAFRVIFCFISLLVCYNNFLGISTRNYISIVRNDYNLAFCFFLPKNLFSISSIREQ